MADLAQVEAALVVNGWAVVAVQRNRGEDSWQLRGPDGLRISFLQSEAIERAKATGQWWGWEAGLSDGVATAHKHHAGTVLRFSGGNVEALAATVKAWEESQAFNSTSGATAVDE